MGQLGPLDLDRLPTDARGFLGRVLQIGRSQDLLPEGFAGALTAFLRARAMAHARRYRTGLTIDRAALEPGVRQGFTCVEVALRHTSSGDLRRALEVLTDGDLEGLRRQGWERVWKGLDEIRQEAAALLRSPVCPLLGEWHADLRRWATLVPETWVATDAEGEEVRVDPVAQYARYRPVVERGWFLQSLPHAALKSLVEAWPEGAGFAVFLRQLAVALALERLCLPVSAADVERFCATCFDEGMLRPDVRRRVQAQLDEHVDAAVPENRREPWLESPARTPIVQEVRQVMADLERAEPGIRARLIAL